jgi:nitrite reductase/ring-hydroxylating ferredoxin subunit
MDRNTSEDALQENIFPGMGRRSFFKAGLGILSSLAALEVLGGTWLYLRSRADDALDGGLVSAGAVEDYPLNSVTEFTEAGFFLVRDSNGSFLAVHRRCPHLGCQVIWEAERRQFVCPCHASSFDMYGQEESPPVPRPLDTLALSIEDNQIMVDTARISSREKFDPAQLLQPQIANLGSVADE